MMLDNLQNDFTMFIHFIANVTFLLCFFIFVSTGTEEANDYLSETLHDWSIEVCGVQRSLTFNFNLTYTKALCITIHNGIFSQQLNYGFWHGWSAVVEEISVLKYIFILHGIMQNSNKFCEEDLLYTVRTVLTCKCNENLRFKNI